LQIELEVCTNFSTRHTVLSSAGHWRKNGRTMKRGMEKGKTKINSEKIPQCPGPQTWCAYQETHGKDLMDIPTTIPQPKERQYNI